MPYIKKERRDEFYHHSMIENSGDLNYLMTLKCLDYIKKTEKRYKNYNDIIGVLDCLKTLFMKHNKIHISAKIISKTNNIQDELLSSIHDLLYSSKDSLNTIEIIGAIECCKMEFYRRAIAVYENEAIKKNGDVF